ncbi:MAG: MlaD family protein [Bacteroidota bacterium]
MSNEAKIGILAAVAIALTFWGYKFILGKNVLLKSNVFYVVYEDVDRLMVGTPVVIRGVEVGNVAARDFEVIDGKEQVKITLDMEDEVQIPKNTVAVIIATGFMGGKAVVLEYDVPCSGSQCAQSGDYLKGEFRGLLTSMMSEDQLDNYVNTIKQGLQEVLQEELGPNSNSELSKGFQDLRGTLSNLNSVTGQLDNLLQRTSASITGTLANVASITETLDTSKQRISNILGNADKFTEQLTELELKNTLEEVDSTIGQLQNTLSAADSAIVSLNTALQKVANGEGTLGKLLEDDQLYNNLSKLGVDIDSLVTDIQNRPYRYVPFKGRKRVKRYDRKDGGE